MFGETNSFGGTPCTAYNCINHILIKLSVFGETNSFGGTPCTTYNWIDHILIKLSRGGSRTHPSKPSSSLSTILYIPIFSLLVSEQETFNALKSLGPVWHCSHIVSNFVLGSGYVEIGLCQAYFPRNLFGNIILN